MPPQDVSRTGQRFRATGSAGGDSQEVRLAGIDPSQRKLAIIFTCTVCDTKQTKMFSHLSYTKGVVLIKCDGCKGHHLIADNLGWFSKTPVNVESLASEQGEQVRRLSSYEELEKAGVMEILPDAVRGALGVPPPLAAPNPTKSDEL